MAGARLRTELEAVGKLGYVKVEPETPTMLLNWKGYIMGPEKSPFNGLKLGFKVEMGVNFQNKGNPPKVIFYGDLFHPIVFPHNPKDPKWAANREGVVGQVATPLLDKAVWSKESSMAAVFAEIYAMLRKLPDSNNQQLWMWNCLFSEQCVKDSAYYGSQASSTAIALNKLTISKGH